MNRTAVLVASLCAAMAVPQAYAGQDGFEVTTVAENLRVPWAIDFAPDGRIFFTERGGDVSVIEDGEILKISADRIGDEVVEGGVLGIALDPDFGDNRHVYVYHTYVDFIFTYNKVVRFTEAGNALGDELVLVDRIPGGPIHDGGRIKFGPDGKLYIATGDAGNAEVAQRMDSLGGKILRINPDGSIPEDNPFEDSPVYSSGHRNPQGLDWDPDTGMLVISEHGPSGERGFAHDEINVIREGGNYGWPDIVGGEARDGLETPILHSGSATWAPSGATFYDSDEIPEFSGMFLVATLAGNRLMAVDLDLESGRAIGSEPYFDGEFGRLRDVAADGEWNVYILTSNRDGRGSPVQNDDRILKISPARGAEHRPSSWGGDPTQPGVNTVIASILMSGVIRARLGRARVLPLPGFRRTPPGRRDTSGRACGRRPGQVRSGLGSTDDCMTRLPHCGEERGDVTLSCLEGSGATGRCSLSAGIPRPCPSARAGTPCPRIPCRRYLQAPPRPSFRRPCQRRSQRTFPPPAGHPQSIRCRHSPG